MEENSKGRPRQKGKPKQDYLSAFQRGEEKGFTYFFNALYPALLFYAFRLLDDKTVAKTVAEGAFVKIWEKHATFTHPKVIKMWLYTTVHTDADAWLKKNPRPLKKKVGKGKKDTSEINEMIRAEVIRELHANIQSLPAGYRQIFKMVYIQGKSVEDIAKELELSTVTVKNKMSDGRTLLQKRFSDS